MPYVHICLCAHRGTGCRLTAEEVAVLSCDDAILSAALDELGDGGFGATLDDVAEAARRAAHGRKAGV